MIEDTLQTLERALKEEDSQAAAEAARRLDAQIPGQRAKEQAVASLGRTVVSETESEDIAETAQAARQAAAESLGHRGRIYSALYEYNTDQIDEATAAERVSTYRETVGSFESASASLSEVKSDVEIPPVLVATIDPTQLTVPLGGPVEGAIDLRNVGGATAEGIIVTTDSTNGTFTADPDSIGSVPANGSRRIDIRGSPTKEGSVSVKIEANNGTLAQTDLQFNVQSKQEYIGAVLTGMRDLFTQLFSLIPESERPTVEEVTGGSGNSGDGNSNRNSEESSSEGGKQSGQSEESGYSGPFEGLINKLVRTVEQLVAVFEDVEKGKSSQSVAGKLDACQNRLGAFSNQVEAQSGQEIPEKRAVELLGKTEELQSAIDDTIAADTR